MADMILNYTKLQTSPSVNTTCRSEVISCTGKRGLRVNAFSKPQNNTTSPRLPSITLKVECRQNLLNRNIPLNSYQHSNQIFSSKKCFGHEKIHHQNRP